MFNNLQVYRLRSGISAETLTNGFAKAKFAPCEANEIESIGFTAPSYSGELIHVVNQQFLCALRTEKKRIPKSVVDKKLAELCHAFEENAGFSPGKKARKDLKEQAMDMLIPTAFAVPSVTRFWIDPVNYWLVIDTSSPSKADEVIKHILKFCDTIPLEGLRVKMSPEAAMTSWLSDGEAPFSFSIDQDAKLVSPTEDKATVKFSRHTLNPESIQSHIAQGKHCTELAMTWNERISFVLTSSLTIKRIKQLDILDEERDKGANKEERFDSDFVLMTSELQNMLSALTAVLGGEMESI